MSYKLVFIGIFISFLAFTSCNKDKKKPLLPSYPNDSLTNYLKLIENDSLSLEIRDSIAQIAHKIALKNNDSSSTTKILFHLVKIAYNLENDRQLIKYYPTALIYSNKTKNDSINGKLHYFLGYYFSNNFQLDSSYYHFYQSNKKFKLLNDTLLIGMSYMNLAIIQKNKRDYVGSEQTTIKALTYFEQLKKNRAIASMYNNLGTINKELQKFPKAIEYHTKALNLRRNLIDNPNLSIESLVSISNVYKESKKYYKSMYYLDSIYNSKTFKSIPKKLQAIIIDNLTYTKFLIDPNFNNLTPSFEAALNIRLQEKDKDGIVISYIHMGEYFINKDIYKSIDYFSKAKLLALETKNYRDVLVSLKHLAGINQNKSHIKHLNEYFKISDSLEVEKNKISDHFARIRYESDSKEQENKQLKTEKETQQVLLEKERTRKWVLGSGMGVSLITLGIFGFYYQRNKKQKNTIENLQKELHHRIKNNLGIIDSFIEITKEEFTDKPFENKLTELQNRVSSINQIHQQLYSNKDITNLHLKKYIESLSKNIENSFSNKNILVSLNINESIKIDSNKLFSIGLIVNEFLTNSYKYAFDTNNGNITIEIKEENKSYLLSLKDNGKGLPENFDLNKTSTFGIRIMKLLTEQLNGSFNLKTHNGLLLTIQFPK